MSDAGNDGDDGEGVPYLLIHVLPNATGEKPQREIVPADCIKRFQYEVYKTEKNVYKDKKFNYKRAPDGEKYKCYVLYAARKY